MKNEINMFITVSICSLLGRCTKKKVPEPVFKKLSVLIGKTDFFKLYIMENCKQSLKKSALRDRTESCFFLKLFNWRLITLQYCGGFCHALT